MGGLPPISLDHHRHRHFKFLPNGPHQVAAMANLGAELLQEVKAYRPAFLWKSSPAEIIGALIEEIALSDASHDVLTERHRQVEK